MVAGNGDQIMNPNSTEVLTRKWLTGDKWWKGGLPQEKKSRFRLFRKGFSLGNARIEAAEGGRPPLPINRVSHQPCQRAVLRQVGVAEGLDLVAEGVGQRDQEPIVRHLVVLQ